ncbi:hypothetical protein CK203_097186 [Vitis vinifera]|uniref:Uncharacterized protein n=1 Tax=Vitis vinifera TaxID=29760 RepID=A0A438EUQ5_VITVI|nr:hypothetical protein CK203_097186 [Vitis vinifera]
MLLKMKIGLDSTSVKAVPPSQGSSLGSELRRNKKIKNLREQRGTSDEGEQQRGARKAVRGILEELEAGRITLEGKPTSGPRLTVILKMQRIRIPEARKTMASSIKFQRVKMKLHTWILMRIMMKTNCSELLISQVKNKMSLQFPAWAPFNATPHARVFTYPQTSLKKFSAVALS